MRRLRINALQAFTVLGFIGLIGVAVFFRTYLSPVLQDFKHVFHNSDRQMFSGIRKATSAEIYGALPQARNQPTLIEFGSKYCLDCQRMAPIVQAVLARFPKLYVRHFDIQSDQAGHPDIFRAFQPSMVPTFIFISSQGEIIHVLYGYHSSLELSRLFNVILKGVASSQDKKG